MASRRWKKGTVEGNGEEVIPCWRLDGFLIHLNVDQGSAREGVKDRHGDRWWFEVFGDRDVTLGSAPTLRDAKAIADAVMARKEPPTFTPTYEERQPVAPKPKTPRPESGGLLAGLSRFRKKPVR